MFRYRSTPAKCIVRINAAGYLLTRPRLFFVRCYYGQTVFYCRRGIPAEPCRLECPSCFNSWFAGRITTFWLHPHRWSCRLRWYSPLSFCTQPLAVCGSMTISTNRRRTAATSALVAVPAGSKQLFVLPARMPACCMDLTASFAQEEIPALSAKFTTSRVFGMV